MNIVILDAYVANPGDLSWDGLRRYGELTVYDRTTEEQIVPRIGDAEVILTNKTPITRQTLEACPKLKMIGVLATGYNIIDVDAAKERGIPVCNIPAYSTQSVAQHTLALLLEVCSQVGVHDAAVHRGDWQSCADFSFTAAPITELAGKTVGVVGYGKIGQAFGAVCLALGMRLLVTAAHPRNDFGNDNISYVNLETLLSQSDVISLHCPQTAQTAGMIDAAALARMKPGAILLNTARGGLIDEQAVADALRAGKLKAYAADVVATEPILPENPLLKAPNCVLTPHIAWAFPEARRRLLAITEQNVKAFCEGSPVHVVNGV